MLSKLLILIWNLYLLVTSQAVGDVLLQNWFTRAHPYATVVLTADYLLGKKAETRSF